MLALNYARVSTDEQAKHGYSLTSQVDECRARALTLGATEILDFVEEGVSGSTLDRPALNSLRDKLKSGLVGLVVVHDPDRLARNLSHQLIITEEIEKSGARLEFVNFEWKNTAEGKLFYSLRGAISEFEKAKIGERMMRGKRKKAQGGGIPHYPGGIYGYVFNKVTDCLTPDPATAPVVQMMFDWFTWEEEAGPQEIARRLGAQGIPAPKGGKWHRATVRRILLQSAYRGTWYVNRWTQDPKAVPNKRLPGAKQIQRPPEERIAIPVSPIIEADQWEFAQLRLLDARRRWQDRQGIDYLLSGWCTCGLCGGPVHGWSYTRPKGRYRYYICINRTHRPEDKCSLPYVNADELEAEVWGRVASWVQDPHRLERELRQRANIPPADHGEVATLDGSIAASERESDRLTSLYVKGLIDPKKAEDQLVEIRRRLQLFRSRRTEISRRREVVRIQDKERATLQQFSAKYSKRLSGLTFKEKQGLIRLMVAGVELFPDRIEVHARIPASTLAF